MKKTKLQIDPLLLSGALVSLVLAIATGSGDLQQVVSFAGIANEIGFFALSCIACFAFLFASFEVTGEVTP